jgi:hypothetical protein
MQCGYMVVSFVIFILGFVGALKNHKNQEQVLLFDMIILLDAEYQAGVGARDFSWILVHTDAASGT